jgi:hypothetical protein
MINICRLNDKISFILSFTLSSDVAKLKEN